MSRILSSSHLTDCQVGHSGSDVTIRPLTIEAAVFSVVLPVSAMN